MQHPDPMLMRRNRQAPHDLSPEELRALGRQVVDQIADFLASLPGHPVAPGEAPAQVWALLGDRTLPEEGAPAAELLREAAELLFDHSVFNSHPRFWGYITSSPAPIGILADLLAAGVNANVAFWTIAPLATEIESQTIRWLAELIGYRATGGILVSGGNMANLVAFLAARCARLPWDVRQAGMAAGKQAVRVYVSQAGHTWIQKAADMFGLGLDAIRWILTNTQQQMNATALERQITADVAAGALPLLTVGTADTVGVGAVDPLAEIARICRKYDLWFHVDGAYGAPAACLPEASPDLTALALADSVALDPHKWLYAPIECGCTLVRDVRHLADAFSFHPEYYNLAAGGEVPLNYYELGPQNTRGFRALKVWLGLQLVGREGTIRMIRDDIALARALFESVQATEELQAFTHSLSITTFRYVPPDLARDDEGVASYLNNLNRELLNRLQAGGEAYVSNAIIDGAYALRACIVNFRTELADIEALPEIVIRIGRAVDAELRPMRQQVGTQ